MKSAVTLAEVAAKTRMLESACSQCNRRGRQSLLNLIAEYGADMGLPDRKGRLAKGCPKLESASLP